MKAVLQLTFVLFYVTSGFAVTQIRTIELIEKIQHTNFGTTEQTVDRAFAKGADTLPRYREAKKAAHDFQCHPIWNVELAPAQTETLSVNDNSQCLDFLLLPSHSRAPPMRA